MILMGLLPAAALAKRAAPLPVAPVVYEGVRYLAPNDDGRRAYIQAWDAQTRKQLEPKVWGGRGSVDDIRMLKAICSHMGDHACRNRAAEMLKKKLEASN